MLFGCAAASLNLTGEQVPVGSAQACRISSNANVVLYDGIGTGTYSRQWEEKFWSWWANEDSRIVVSKLTGPELAPPCRLRDYSNVRLYVQPGGDAYEMQNSIRAGGRSNILGFLNNGGKYFGTCAGWFLASRSYVWQNASYAWPNVLGIFDKTVEGSLTTIANYEGNPPLRVTSIKTGSDSLNVVYYGGPTVGWTRTSPSLPRGWSSIAEFTAPRVNNCPAIVTRSNAVLTSPHLEAFEGIGVTTLSTQDRLANYQYRARQINALLGTNWRIPSTA